MAADNGINIVSQEYSVSWDYSQAIFFVITILTTIGYGNSVTAENIFRKILLETTIVSDYRVHIQATSPL